jgi:von Willebrand factor type A domain-containing protein
MNSIVFQYPEYLWVLPIALAAIVLLRLVRRRPYAAFPLTSLLALRRYRASRLRHVPTVIAAAALPLIAVALTQPVLPYAQGQMTSRGLDIVLVLDLSLSMQELMGQPGVMPPPVRAAVPAAIDYSKFDISVDQYGTYRMTPKPGVVIAAPNRAAGTGANGQAPNPAARATRLEMTKRALIEFIARRRDDRIGLVVFSEHSYLISPMTFDHESLTQYVELVDDKILPGEAMTAIGDGLTLASSLLARQSKSRVSGNQVIVIFTDGENNFGTDPIKALEAADSAGTRVHIVAVDLQEVIRKRPAVQGLMNAVTQHGGHYFNVEGAGQLRAASLAIDSLEKGFVQQTEYIRNRPVYDYFVIPAILLLVAALLLRAVPYFIDLT